MATYISNLFHYGRALPAPFDKLTGKKVKVASKYTAGETEATLCATVIKAIQAVCGCMSGKGLGAVGTAGSKCLAEYKSSVDAEDTYHIVVYDRAKGVLMASVYNRQTDNQESYVLNSSGRDGAGVLMALFPVLMEDDEFREHFDGYFTQYQAGFPDQAQTTECMAYLCDNAYRRIKDETCPAHIKLELDRAGNLMRVPRSQLDSGNFTPTDVTAGEFTVFAKTGPAVIHRAGILMEAKDFEGKYCFQPRRFTPDEQLLIPKLPDWYIIPQEVIDICRHAQATTDKPSRMRNFLLRGPAGTGKTMGARAIAAGLGLPYVKFTCSAGTEIFDFIGQILPDFHASAVNGDELDREREALRTMGGMTYENLAKLMHLPGLDDLDYDPAGVWRSLTGTNRADATGQDCVGLILERVTEKVCALSHRAEADTKQGQTYTYADTDFLRALRNGYVVEIQEPTTIIQPGVLVGLNALLETDGSITLPTGEVIRRHPDAVVVVTTNISYEGCRGMNQSTVDRMSLVKDMELPSPEIMVQRAMSVTGCEDETLVSRMVDVTVNLNDYCRKNCISDGTVGMRSLIDWIVSTGITEDAYASALSTVISKATASEEDREALVTAVLEPIFPPRRARA